MSTERPRWILALDLSGPDVEVLVDQAAAWAGPAGARVTLLYAAGVPYDPGIFADPGARKVISRENDALRQRHVSALEALALRLPEAIRAPVVVAPTAATAALVEASENADTLLIGTHPRRGLAQMWLGSVAEYVVRRARCAVLVLRVRPAHS